MAQDLLTDTYLRFRDRFRMRANRILGSVDDADDALQEAFYKLWKRDYDVQTAEEAKALLTTAVRNTSLDAVRRRRDKVPLDAADTLPADDRRDRLEQLSDVQKLIENELSDTQRYIIERFEYCGIKQEQIAEELGMQPAAVRMQLSRARKTIRELYNKRNL